MALCQRPPRYTTREEMMDAQQRSRIRQLAAALRAVGESIKAGEYTVDAAGSPLPGTPFAALNLLLAMGYPDYKPRRPSKN